MLETVLSSNLDVFINNAYANHYQTNLLKRTYDAWKFRDKLLVNIGSAASLIPKEHPDYNMEYASDKREQRNFCAEQNFLYSKENNATSNGLVSLYAKDQYKKNNPLTNKIAIKD